MVQRYTRNIRSVSCTVMSSQIRIYHPFLYRLNGKSVPLFYRIRDGAVIDTRKFHQWISSRKRPYAASRDITAGTGGATATPILTTTEV